MKSVIKNTKKGILIVTMLATVIGYANETKLLVKKDAKKTALTIENIRQGNILSIKDYNGIVLYKELIEIHGVYKKGFDLTQLPNGNYFFEVEKDLEIDTLPFIVKSNQVTFNIEGEKVFFKPFTVQKNDLVYITKLALNNEPLDINIYANVDGEYELLYSEKIENTQIIERIFKLEKEVTYKIVLNSDNKEYTKFIN